MSHQDRVEAYKRQAGERAVEFVLPGMIVGLGTGTTAIYATRAIGRLLSEGVLRDVRAVATSSATAAVARDLHIPLVGDDDAQAIDLTIDGADEVNPALDLIKGGGGALLREKIVAQASRRRVIVVDDSKLSQKLGMCRAVPVEVVPFGWRRQADYLVGLGASVELRSAPSGEPFHTDQGNFILDCAFGPISDPPGLAAAIRARAGIVEHGLFVGLASDLVVAGADGLRHIPRQSG